MTETVAFKFKRGAAVVHTITGLKGIIMVQTHHLNGCIRYGVQPSKLDKGGTKVADILSVDECELELDKKGTNIVAPSVAATRPGGPQRGEMWAMSRSR